MLFAVAVTLVVFGGQKWLYQRDITAVVHSFFTAIREGNTAHALQLLEPALRKKREQRQAAENEPLVLFEPGLEYNIHHCEIKKGTAEVEVWIKKEGFLIKPIVHLRKSASKQWKISEITNLQADPLWDDIQQLRGKEHDHHLAEQLRQELAKQPGLQFKK